MDKLTCRAPGQNGNHQEGLALEMIKSHGLRLTLPRRLAVELLARTRGPLTIDEIHSEISRAENNRSVDLVTVYRIMTKLEEIAIVIRCDFNDGLVRYELAADGHHHHHIVCRVCRLTTPIEACDINALPFLPKDHGYQNITHRLEFFGVCPICSEKSVLVPGSNAKN